MPVPPLSLAAVRQPAFLYDADGRIAEANDLAEALAGRPLAGRTLAAVVGIFDIRSPDGTPLLAADLPAVRALAGEEAVDVPLVVRAADGRTLHVLATAAPIRNGGAVVGALSIWQDISVRERMRPRPRPRQRSSGCTEEELRQQGMRARPGRLRSRPAAAAPRQHPRRHAAPRLALGPGRAARLGERALRRGSREPREALAGRTWRGLWRDVPWVVPLADGALQSVAAGTPFTSDVETAGPAGRDGWPSPSCRFRPDSLLVITEDVTARKRADEAPAPVSRTSLVDAVSDAVISTDTDMIIRKLEQSNAERHLRLARPTKWSADGATDILPDRVSGGDKPRDTRGQF